MTKSESNTNEQPVNVRLSLQDWMKVIGVVAVVTVGQTWAASRYFAGIEARINQAEKTNDDQNAALLGLDSRLQTVRDNIGTTLMPMSRDIGEIKGKLEVMVQQMRSEVK